MTDHIPIYITDLAIEALSFSEPFALVIRPRLIQADETGCQLMVDSYLWQRFYPPTQYYGRLLTNQGMITSDVIRSICKNATVKLEEAFPDGAYLFAHHRHFRANHFAAHVGPDAVDEMMKQLHHVALLDDSEIRSIYSKIATKSNVCTLEHLFDGFSLENVRHHYKDHHMKLPEAEVDYFQMATRSQISVSADQIRQICRDWRQATMQPDNTMHIQPGLHRLMSVPVGFHLIDFDALCTALVETAIIAIHSNVVVIREKDHVWLLSWRVQVMENRRVPQLPVVDPTGYKDLMEACLHGILVDRNPAFASRDDCENWDRYKAAMPLHLRGLLESSHTVAGYLVFPLLEATFKRACSAYIDTDGNVLQAFDITDEGGNRGYYGPRDTLNPYGKKRRRKCSSLEDMMRLHYETADPDMRAYLDPFYDHLKTVVAVASGETPSAFSTIYEWRCSSLHGSTGFSRVASTLLNLCMLIALWPMRAQYDSIRLALVGEARWLANCTPRAPWSFYPPY